MKAITVWQLWATALALGIKKNETRSWPTKYRGPIAIHAAARNDGLLRGSWMDVNNAMSDAGHDYFIRKVLNGGPYYIEYRDENREVICDLEFGAIIGTANLVDCVEITPEYISTLSPQELALGDYTLGRYAWVMHGAKLLDESIPYRGQQRIWEYKGKLRV